MAESEDRGPVDVGQVIVGLIALAVSAWGLIGAPSLHDSTVAVWVGVAVAAAVGLALVVGGGVRARRR
ncbi:hypothetical protein [Williamsia deligens]|uniref:Uncharacterized protein n=1 Tax=Williamsia deligens TaxID=321325 RepID=A0ABW3GCW8_9NOCA|nr:hypothetical protein [Williamsia deligens]MCP2192364.1 hypothetical protein [Williamsia deligens]